MSNTTQTQPRIAIIGGGPSGLVLLVTLHKRGIPATLYEREPSSDSRAHLGGMLDLEWETGQRAMRENGLLDVFLKNSRREAEEVRFCGKSGEVLMHLPGKEPTDENLRDSRPEIDRRVLRQILLDAAPSDSVKWGYALSSIKPLEGGQHELTFSNGVVTVADFVVGADGAHSRIRPLLSPAVPLYHGVNGTELSVSPDVVSRPENKDVNDAIGRGSCYVVQDKRMLAFQRNGSGRIRLYAWHQDPLEWTLPEDPKEAKKVLLEIYSDWTPWMKKFIELADENAIYPRPLFYLEVGHRWEHKPGVTLIGDAAHLMSPFSGMGANLAMRDGLELGIVLAETISKGASAEEREAALAVWEAEMFEKVGKFAAFTKKNLDKSFGPDTPHALLKGWQDALARQKEEARAREAGEAKSE
ncbi:monooxygenase FAD-binding protein [Trametes polyzona]|nr:monooxygenase FAD-binding protein [Trametes polyzona]